MEKWCNYARSTLRRIRIRRTNKIYHMYYFSLNSHRILFVFKSCPVAGVLSESLFFKSAVFELSHKWIAWLEMISLAASDRLFASC